LQNSIPDPTASTGTTLAPQLKSKESASTPNGRQATGHLSALIELLGDDSPSLFPHLCAELLRLGRTARPALQRAAKSSNARLRGHARHILQAGERQVAMRRLYGYSLRSEIDLEQALFLLARLDRSQFDSRPYIRALDAMGAEVSLRMSASMDENTRAMALPEYLGGELGFSGADHDFSHPDNIHLHRCLERKRGMPLTLTAIYLLVAKRAGITAGAVALPGRVLLRLYMGRRSVLIDPFAGGRARTRRYCLEYLSEHGLVPQVSWFQDARPTQLFQRHVLNLMSSFQVRDLPAQSRELHQLAMAMGRHQAN
jgi:regulator of sirC expression with transglutaminase-like and TPR domain